MMCASYSDLTVMYIVNQLQYNSDTTKYKEVL